MNKDPFLKYISHYNLKLEQIPRPQPIDFVIKFFNYKENLFFIDVGAHDGITWNNTIALEEFYNWNGICIEPNPIVFEKLKINRKVKKINFGISESDQELEFWMIDGYSEMLSGFSNFYDQKHIDRINKEIKMYGGKINKIPVLSKKLETIFEEDNIINVDYLSIDTEGAELSILKSINFFKTSIKLISVENNGYNDEAAIFLKDNGYRKLTKICHDEFFIK